MPHFQPTFPVTIIPKLRNVLMTERLTKICEALYYNIDQDCDYTSISYDMDEVTTEGTIEEHGRYYEITENDFFLELQNIIRKNGSLKWVAISSAIYAVFITRDDIKIECMNGWLVDHIKEIEPKKVYRFWSAFETPYLPDALQNRISLEQFI